MISVMETIDIGIIVILLWGAIQGWRHGFFKEIISMVGFFVGLFLAYMFYEAFGSMLSPLLSGNPTIAKYLGYILAFVIIWIAVPILLGFVANLLTKSLKLIHLGGINSLRGLVVGLAKYLVLLSFVFSAMNMLHILNQEKRDQSLFFHPIASLSGIFFEGKEYLRDAARKVTKQDTLWIDLNPRNEKAAE